MAFIHSEGVYCLRIQESLEEALWHFQMANGRRAVVSNSHPALKGTGA